MATHPNSKASYAMALESGLIGDAQCLVLETIRVLKSATANDVWNYLLDHGHDVIQNTLNSRYAELRDMGFIETHSNRIDPKTGALNQIWSTCDTWSDEQIAAYKLKKKERKTYDELEKELEALKRDFDEMSQVAQAAVDACEQNNPAKLLALPRPKRYEIRADGKPGMTFSAREKSRATDAIEVYCATFRVPLVAVKFHVLETCPGA